MINSKKTKTELREREQWATPLI